MIAKPSSPPLADALKMFKGLEPHEIATVLRRKGIKGRQHTLYRCPLAMEFHETCKGSFAVGKKKIMRRIGDKIETVPTPANLAEFLAKFDVGAYPHLIASPPRALPKKPVRHRPGNPGGSAYGSHGNANRSKLSHKRVVRHKIVAMIGGR